MIFVYILNYNIGKCEIISMNEDIENIEEKLQELGYRLSEISWMTSNNLQLSINI